MPDERSPLLQNGRNSDYLAGREQTDSAATSDAEQQTATVVAPHNSVITLVIFPFFLFRFILNETNKKVVPMAIGIFLSAMDQTIIVACV